MIGNHQPLPDGGVVAESPDIDTEDIETALKASRNVQHWFLGTEEDVTDSAGPIGLGGRIIDNAGDCIGKYEPPVSLSTHIINTVVVGLNTFLYDEIVRAGNEIDQEKGRLLMGALALHDANKYVGQAYDTDLDTSNNTLEVLDFYFDEGDDFGICDVLPGSSEKELQRDIADVKWLIQRTEATEDGSDTRGESTKRVRGLERYCRMGDGFVSKTGQDGLAASAEWLRKRYPSDEGSHVHFIRFTDLEQPIIASHLLSVIKGAIGDDAVLDIDLDTDPRGIVLGTTSQSIAYLGSPIDRDELRSIVESSFMDHITERYSFDCKTEWRSFDPDILTEISIGIDAKRDVIADGYAETLSAGSGTDHEFESIPTEYREYLPELAHLIFESQEFETAFDGLSELPRLKEQVLESEDYNNQTWKIGFLAELLRRFRGTVDDGFDPETLNWELEELQGRIRSDLEEVLTPKVDAGEEIVSRFFEGGSFGVEELLGSDEMCFLCGRHATTEFKKGRDGFYGTNKFSRRVPPEGQYKKICSVCNLEHALLKDDCEGRGSRFGDDTEIAYVYYDDFLAGVTIGSHAAYDLMEEDSGYTVADPELLADSMMPQFHIQPFYAPGQNNRLSVIRNLLETLVGKGLKVTVGKPFTTFRPKEALLADLNPGRRQVAFGVHKIRSKEDKERALALFDLLSQVAGQSESIDQSNVYISVPDDGFRTLADLVVKNTDWYSGVRAQAHNYFTTHSDTNEYMLMRKVAQNGLELYGKQYDSRHKKTKIFREAIDSTLDGLNRDKDGEELREHVAGQVYKAAKTEKYAPQISTDKAEEFVDSLFSFLQEEGTLNKKALSGRRNTLTNTYLFAYDQLLNEQNEESE